MQAIMRANFLWELWTGLYMLDASEKVAFNSIVVVLLAIAASVLGPSVSAAFGLALSVLASAGRRRRAAASSAAAVAVAAGLRRPQAERAEARRQRSAGRQSRACVGLAIVVAFMLTGGVVRALSAILGGGGSMWWWPDRWTASVRDALASYGVDVGGGSLEAGGADDSDFGHSFGRHGKGRRRSAGTGAATPRFASQLLFDASVPTLAPFDPPLLELPEGEDRVDILSLDSSGAPRLATDEVTIVLVATLGDLDRASLLLASLRKWLDPAPAAGARELIVLSPRGDALVWETAAAGLPVARVRILGDDALLRGLSAPAYSTQMLLKLLVARYVASEFYLVLDADVLLAGPLDVRRDLLREGRAMFEPHWRNAHREWWAESEALLRARSLISAAADAIVMGVTPAVLSRTIAARAVRRLRRLYGDGATGGGSDNGGGDLAPTHPSFGRGWLYLLYHAFVQEGRFWTEFSLYFIAGHAHGGSEGWADGLPADLFAQLHFAPPAGERRLLGLMTGASAASCLAYRAEYPGWRRLRAQAFEVDAAAGAELAAADEGNAAGPSAASPGSGTGLGPGPGPGPSRQHLFVVLQSRTGIPASVFADAVAPFLRAPRSACVEAAA